MDVELLYKDVKIKDGDVIVFGCSYGPDSMALFHTLLTLRKKIDIKLICAHVNHGKRKESEEEKVLLEEYCKKHNVTFEYMKIKNYGDDNFHNEARNIRYNFFEEIVNKYQAKYLMTAHHADDLMETILMRIVRGSNIYGYSGFKKVVDMNTYTIYRPFFAITKSKLLDYDHKYKIPYAIDASNNSSVYTRNRYRKEVLPFLKKEDSKVEQKFIKFHQTLDEVSSYLHKEVEKALTKVVSHDKLLIEPFNDLDIIIQKLVLEEMLKRFYQDDLVLISDKHLDAIFKIISSRRANVKLNFPNDVVIRKSYNTIEFERNTEIIDSYEIELSNYAKLPNGHVLKIVEEDSGNSNYMTRLSSKELTLPLRVRTREYGDTLLIKNGGHKKLKKIFIDEKIPLKDRDLWPVVVDSKNQIVFLPGIKKTKYDKKKDEFYDIILKYE